MKVPGGPDGDVDVRIVRPARTTGDFPVIVYAHGAGWVLGNAHTHDRLVRELAVGTGAAVVFPEYTRSPEARYGGGLYRRRKAMIEPVFAQTKHNRRIDSFQRRGRPAVRSEWRLITATHNLMKLHKHQLAAAGA